MPRRTVYPTVPMPQGSDPLRAVGDLMQLAGGMQQMRARDANRRYEEEEQAYRQETRQQQQAARTEQTAAEGLTASALRQGDDGLWSFDRDFLRRSMQQAKISLQRQGEIFGDLDAVEQDTVKFRAARQDSLESVLAGIYKNGNTTEAYQIGREFGLKNKIVTEQDLKPYDEMVAADPTNIATITMHGLLKSKRFAGLVTAAEKAPGTRSVTVTNSDGTETIKIVKDEPGQEFTSTPRPAATSEFDDYLALPPEQRLQREKDRARWQAVVRAPDAPDPVKAATITQKASAERWKQDALATLEDRYRASQSGWDARRSQAVAPMSVAELETQKTAIQKSYLEQIGALRTTMPAVATPPPAPARVAGSPQQRPEAIARDLVALIKRKEAAGQDASAERRQYADLKAQAQGSTR